MIIKRKSKHLSSTAQQPRRPSGTHEQIKMYNSKAWRTLRRLQIEQYPLCAECLKRDRLTPATVADHIKQARLDEVEFFDQSNLQSLCASCHNKKSAKESKLNN
jgi:5-methylcytosine-specific restriction enzyme A